MWIGKVELDEFDYRQIKWFSTMPTWIRDEFCHRRNVEVSMEAVAVVVSQLRKNRSKWEGDVELEEQDYKKLRTTASLSEESQSYFIQQYGPCNADPLPVEQLKKLLEQLKKVS